MGVAIKLMLVVALVAAPTFDKPTLVTRVFPQMQLADPAIGGAYVQLTAELKGPESEEWYCPAVTWLFPDGTESFHEQDCAPFEMRNQCWPEQPKDCGLRGFRWNPITEKYVDDVKECSCNITGYPNIWRITKGAPAHPKSGQPWEVWVKLTKNGKVLARQPIRFYIMGGGE